MAALCDVVENRARRASYRYLFPILIFTPRGLSETEDAPRAYYMMSQRGVPRRDEQAILFAFYASTLMMMPALLLAV